MGLLIIALICFSLSCLALWACLVVASRADDAMGYDEEDQ